MHFFWTKFTFEAPPDITQAQFTLARERPDELHRSARVQVRETARRAVPAMILPLVAAVGCFGLAALFNFSSGQTWQATVINILLLVGVAMSFSTVLTVGSFLHYAAATIAYWREMTKTALGHASYSEFLTAWTRRQQVGIAGDRKLPWWISWLILAGVLLAIYLAASWYGPK